MVKLLLHVVLVCIASAKAILGDESFLNTTYDYIIVGGGTSGLTVANRLTESGKHTVLVLEYGPLNNDSGILIPADTLLSHPSRSYNITSLPIAGLNNATRPVLAGALVGGGSAINGMFFDRGSASDYDAWQDLGNPGWNFSTLLPYFRKSVTFTPPSREVAERLNYTWDENVGYGGKGEVQVSFPPYQFPGREFLWAAWKEMRIKTPVEAAGGDAIGAIQAPSALDPVSRTRSYARTAHYDGVIAGRPNYILRTGWRVMEVVTKGEGKELEAVGVSISKRGGDGSKVVVKARKEVVIAAGAVWTPWLLQRSGIGPKEVLEKAGIPVKKHLPGVGANFQDHPIGGAIWNWTTNSPSPIQNDLVTNTSFYSSSLQEYTSSQTGPLTVARGNQAAFLPLKTVLPDKWRDLISTIATQDPTPYLPTRYESTLTAGFRAQQRLTATLLARSDSAAYEFPFSSGPLGSGVLMRPLSRGTITINTSDTSANPVVDYRTFSNPLDIALSIPLIPFARRFNALSTFSGLGPVELRPGANVTSDADVEAYLRATFVPTFAHPSGTAGMMPLELGGVVDTELRVYGVGRLSVVDASVIPYLPATHICTTVYAVAERGADLIKARAE